MNEVKHIFSPLCSYAQKSYPISLLFDFNRSIFNFQIFRIIDQDGDGNISKADLREVSKRIGLVLSNRDMDDMFDVADKDSDGQVDFEGEV